MEVRLKMDTIGLVIIVLSFALLLLGFPIFVAFGLGGFVIAVISGGFSIGTAADFFYNNINNFSMLAAPFFIFAGELMLAGGSSKRLLAFINSFFEKVPGRLAVASIFACAFFSAISGSSLATASAIGTIMIPAMLSEGYGAGEATGAIAASACLGNLIPPSLFFILFAAMLEISVGELFIAGIIPGIALTIMMAIVAMIVNARTKRRAKVQVSWKERRDTLIKAIPALFMPVIVLGGIYFGIFTPTEAAAVSSVYAIFCGFFIYRELTPTNLWRAMHSSVRVTGSIFVVIAGASLFGKMLIFIGLPQAMLSMVMTSNLGMNVFLALSIIAIIILGMLTDALSTLYISVPLLYPTMVYFNIDPIHFGVITILGLLASQTTPPVGIMLYFTANLANVPSIKTIMGALPYVVVIIITYILVVYFPILSLWLVSTMG